MNWTKVGAHHTEGRHEEFEKAFRSLTWREPRGRFSMSSGMAFEKMIADLPGSQVLALAETPAFAPFNLLAMCRKFSDYPAIIYALDEGTHLTIVASEKIIDRDLLPAIARRELEGKGAKLVEEVLVKVTTPCA